MPGTDEWLRVRTIDGTLGAAYESIVEDVDSARAQSKRLRARVARRLSVGALRRAEPNGWRDEA